MRHVTVDAESRTATCGGGALWEDLDPPCQRHGLATPGGTFVNESRVERPTPLHNGDAIRVGTCLLRFGERQKQR